MDLIKFGNSFSLNNLTKIIFIITAFSCSALAVSNNVGVITGYDSNIELTLTPEDSPFTETYLNSSKQSIYKNLFGESLWFVNFSLKKYYYNSSENLDLSAGGHYSCLPFENNILTQGFFEGGIFRDNENSSNEFNWGKTGLKLQYYYNDKFNVDYIQSVKIRNFLESIDSVEISSQEVYDLTISSDFDMDVELRPWLNLTLSLSFNWLDSTVASDEYYENGGAFSLLFSPFKKVNFTIEAAQFYKSYLNLNSRKDTFSSIGFTINRINNNFEFFFIFDSMENNSTLLEESYKQQVTQCGISLYF